VNNAECVRCLQCIGNLAGKVQGFTQGQSSFALDARGQGFSRQKLHGQKDKLQRDATSRVDEACFALNVEGAAYIGVRDLTRQADFLAEPGECLRVGGDLRADDFQSEVDR